MLSLNEGVELDNELIDANEEAGKELDQLLFVNITPGEVPELNPATDVDALITKLRALDYTQNNLETIGGINQNFVMESQHLVPGLVNETVSLGFYSQDITKTRYKFALEAIAQERTGVVSKMRDAFMKLVHWLIEQIKKLGEWMAALLKRRGPLDAKHDDDHDVSEKFWQARYTSKFGNDVGGKIYEDMKSAIDVFDKRLTSMKVHIGQNFYFAHMHKNTPAFAKFLTGLPNYLKCLELVGHELAIYAARADRLEDSDKTKIADKIKSTSEWVTGYVSELHEFQPAEGELNKCGLLSDQEVARLLFPAMRDEYNNLNSQFAEIGGEISTNNRAVSDLLGQLVTKIDSKENYAYSAADSEIIRTVAGFRSSTSMVFKTMNICADSIRKDLDAYGEVLDNPAFHKAEQEVVARHGGDYAKIKS